MSPLQLSVYWRLSLIFIFTSFLFFVDIFTVAIAEATCHHDNTSQDTFYRWNNQSHSVEGPRSQADWRMESRNQESVCGWSDWLPYGQTLFMVGLLLGSLFGGAVSDRYGKRPLLLASVCVHTLCGLVPALLPQPLVFLAVRCLTGVCCCCINICSFPLAVEWTPPAYRLWPPAFLPFCFSLGTMAGAPLAWLSPTWTQLHLALSVPQLLCLPLYFAIPESPRWLLLRRRTDVLDHYRSSSSEDRQCLDLLLDSTCCDLQKAMEAPREKPPAGHALRDSVRHLRQPVILLRLFIMSYLSAVSALTYFGICMNIGSFGVGVHAAQFFSGLSEAPCLLVPLISLRRRPISMLSLLLSGATCFFSLLLSSYGCEPVLVMSLALMGKLCILAAIFISTLYSIELFPTTVRQRCMSLVNLCFRLGCLANSLVPTDPSGSITLAAMVVYSSGPVVGCVLCLLLPETSGITLPDSIEDCNRQPRAPSLGVLCRTLKQRRDDTCRHSPTSD
ncbi:solute carrier family 22 member 13 [Betta splendens]|uniref:Solute carrier family 22 member 13 n=1 Tax=Betta splendens TaxID=158456 RepID=A0A6P7LXH0_BETSP|nr:solute carrier family 22 member 13 [Betta splendens]